MTIPSASNEDFREIVAEHRPWFLVLGIVLIILGIVAIAFPFVTTIAAKIFLGWLFLAGGIVQIVHAFYTRTWGAFFLDLLIGLLYVIAGAWLAFFPFTGIITLTLVLAFVFIIEGVLEIGMAFQVRPQRNWGWLVVSGIIAIAAGVLVTLGLPDTATWAIGLLVGVNMLFSGLSYVFMTSAVGAPARA